MAENNKSLIYYAKLETTLDINELDKVTVHYFDSIESRDEFVSRVSRSRHFDRVTDTGIADFTKYGLLFPKTSDHDK